MAAESASSTNGGPASSDAQPCPDPSVHDNMHKRSQAASAAALLVTQGDRKSDANSKPKEDILTPDGKLSSRSAAQSLKHAKPQDLPSFPSHGMQSSNAAGAAAMLAKDYRMKELWQPETSAAGSKAAALAAKDGGKLDLWQYSGSATGLSAASLAMKGKSTSPQIDRGYTDAGRTSSLLAATKSHHTGRQRAGSTPVAPPAAYPDSQNSAHNALNAATASHRASSNKMAPDGWDSEANQAARIKNLGSGVMDKDMFGEHPPVKPEVDEKQYQAALRASAVSMAKGMYEQQNRAAAAAAAAAAPAEATRDIGSAGAETAHRRNQSSRSSQPNMKEEAMKYIALQDAAHRLAQERLAKVDKELENERYREHYGYGSASPRRSRMSFRGRGRKRASSEGTADAGDSSDEEQARRIRTQMSQLSTASNTVDDKQRQADRARLMAAAEKRVHERLHTMDEQVFASTGKVPQSMMDEWEAKAREKAEQERDARASLPPGQTHIGGGKYMAQADIEAIAAARLKPTLDELNDTAEKKRARDAEILRAKQARDEELAREKDRKETERMEEKLKAQEQKAEFKRIKEQDKAAVRREKEEAKREKEEQKAAARREKEEAKARKLEDKRKSRETKRDTVAAVAGGAALAEVADKVKDDKEKEGEDEGDVHDAKRDTTVSTATAGEDEKDESEDEEVEEEVREDGEEDDVPARTSGRDAAAAVAGGGALAEIAHKVKTDKDNEGDEKPVQDKEDDAVPERRQSRREKASIAAGGAALAEVANKVKNDSPGEAETDEQDVLDRRQSPHDVAAATTGDAALVGTAQDTNDSKSGEDTHGNKAEEAHESHPSRREKASIAAGGAALAEVAEKVKKDTSEPQETTVKHEPITQDESIRAAALAEVAEKTRTQGAEVEVEPDEGTHHHHSRREKAAAVAGGAALAEVAEKVKHEPSSHEDGVDHAASRDATADHHATRDVVAGGAGGVALAEGAETVKNDKAEKATPTAPAETEKPKQSTPEKEKRKSRGVFGRISDKLKGHKDEDTQDEEKSAPAVAAVSTEKAEKPEDKRVAYTADDNKHEASETAAVGAGVVAAGAAVAAAGHTEEEVPLSADTMSGRNEADELYDNDANEQDDHITDTLASPIFQKNRPDLERHISTIDTSSGESDDDDLLDSDDEEEREARGRAAAVPVADLESRREEEPTVSPLREEDKTAEPQHLSAPLVGAVALSEPEPPVSPVQPDAQPETSHAIMGKPSSGPGPSATREAAAPSPAIKTGPIESDARKSKPSEEKDQKEKGKLRGFFSKLKNRDSNKPEGNKLSKSRPSKEDQEATEDPSSQRGAKYATGAAAVTATGASAGAYEQANAETAHDAKPEDSALRTGTNDAIADPTEVSGLAQNPTTSVDTHMGTDGPIGDPHHVSGLDKEHPERPVSESSFQRHQQPHRDLDSDDDSSGAEEDDDDDGIKRGRAGRLAQKLGLTKDKVSLKQPEHPTGYKLAPAAAGAGEGSGMERQASDVTESNDDSEQFEEARDHFDESLAPPPAFAGQAKNESSPVRGTRFQEQL